jgi:hypothetical protein
MTMESSWSELLKSLPEWLTAIGTLLAVIVALYLARRDRSIRCIAESTIYVLIDSANVDAASEHVTITVTNIGTRVFTLGGVSWRLGLFKRQNYFLIPPPNQYSSRIPVKLSDGEQASFHFPIAHFRDRDRPTLLTNAPKRFRRFWLLFTRLLVHTTTGQTFAFRVHKSIRQELLGVRRSVTR